MLYDIDNNVNKKSWASLTRDILCNLGFYDAWLFQNVGNENIFLSLVKQRINDQYIQVWNNSIQNSSRSSLYRYIANFTFQPYLDVLTIPKYCQAFTRLRVAAHRLEIEAGRWAKPHRTPVVDRKCKFCELLEDEYHFVMECDLYSDLRKQYIPRRYWKRPNMLKFIELLNIQNSRILRNLAIFVHKGYILRNEMLYSV